MVTLFSVIIQYTIENVESKGDLYAISTAVYTAVLYVNVPSSAGMNAMYFEFPNFFGWLVLQRVVFHRIVTKPVSRLIH